MQWVSYRGTCNKRAKYSNERRLMLNECVVLVQHIPYDQPPNISNRKARFLSSHGSLSALLHFGLNITITILLPLS